MTALATCAFAFALAYLLTMAVRHYALKRELIDVPNHRSSHTVPTPRGGGIAIVLTFSAVSTLLLLCGDLSQTAALPILVSSGLVAATGFLDDHFEIAAGWRLTAHFVAAGALLFGVQGLPPVLLFGELIDFGILGNVLAAVYLVWLLNLYNFMDGIDGIAGIEAITVSCFGALLWWHFTLDGRLALWLTSLAASTAGFLVWNFPRARIFMGDAGSGFLGFLLGAFSIIAAWSEPQMLWSWAILLGVFVVDATVTLLRRMARRESLHQAHRSHAYQHASQSLRSHPKVSLAVAAINLAWLLPWAWAVAARSVDGLTAIVVSYLPLVWIAWRLRAGEPHTKPLY